MQELIDYYAINPINPFIMTKMQYPIMADEDYMVMEMGEEGRLLVRVSLCVGMIGSGRVRVRRERRRRWMGKYVHRRVFITAFLESNQPHLATFNMPETLLIIVSITGCFVPCVLSFADEVTIPKEMTKQQPGLKVWKGEQKVGKEEQMTGKEEQEAGKEEQKTGKVEQKVGKEEQKAGKEEPKAGKVEQNTGKDLKKASKQEPPGGTNPDKDSMPGFHQHLPKSHVRKAGVSSGWAEYKCALR